MRGRRRRVRCRLPRNINHRRGRRVGREAGEGGRRRDEGVNVRSRRHDSGTERGKGADSRSRDAAAKVVGGPSRRRREADAWACRGAVHSMRRPALCASHRIHPRNLRACAQPPHVSCVMCACRPMYRHGTVTGHSACAACVHCRTLARPHSNECVRKCGVCIVLVCECSLSRISVLVSFE